MIRKGIVNKYKLLCFVSCLFIVTGCKASTKEKEMEQPSVSDNYVETASVLVGDNEKEQKFKTEHEAWVDEHVNKNFLLGKVNRNKNPLFVKVGAEHTKRNIYLISSVYEAYMKMYEAALADNVKLIITSGHRTFVEQVCEWELRWNNPGTDVKFSNDVEKAKYVLQYRSMPGTSRHHWGTDIDLNSIQLSYFTTKEGQAVYNWLKENAATYGFYQSYTPLDEKRPTGYQEEKWHWSYKPLAQLMLVKYLELISIDDICGFKGDVAGKELPVISEWICGINPQMREDL